MQIMTNYSSMPVRYSRTLEQPITTQPVLITQQPAFKASLQQIQKPVVRGLYKDYPEQAKKVLETIKEDTNVMDFIKKYGTRLVIYAQKKSYNGVSSHVRIKYKNPYLSTLEKIKSWISNNTEDELEHTIDISGFGTDIYQTTLDLCQNCESERGCLSSHVKMHLEKINELKAKKEAQIATVAKKQAYKKEMEQEKQKSTDELNKVVDEFFK